VQVGQSEGVPEEGGLPSAMATAMVTLLRGQIPTAACVGACTMEGVLLEIVYFPNYILLLVLLVLVMVMTGPYWYSGRPRSICTRLVPGITYW